MQNIKPNRAQRRAAQSKRPANYCRNKMVKKNTKHVKMVSHPAPQIAAPSRATRFAGIT
jgi:hypothetical protein